MYNTGDLLYRHDPVTSCEPYYISYLPKKHQNLIHYVRYDKGIEHGWDDASIKKELILYTDFFREEE